MRQKRRDNKKRVLWPNETQMKDGKYRYQYVDRNGKRKSVYSWRLVDSDRAPRGKRATTPLRELEAQIDKELEMPQNQQENELTVVELCNKYLLTNVSFRENTKAGHRTTMKILEAHPFGQMPISKVTVLDAKLFLVSLQQEQGRSYSSIHSVRGVLRPAFQLAYECEYIHRNPFDFPLKDVLVNDSVTRDAITRDQERKFLKFLREDPHFCQYYDAIYLLFKTGMRISEFCGLTVKDIDLVGRSISIDHQLQRRADGSLYVIEPNLPVAQTKTRSGTRVIPMLNDEVVEAFRRLMQNRPYTPVEPVVDGYSGFIILNTNVRKDIRPMVAMDWEHIFNRAVTKYNSIYKDPLPNITPHICRHTCCNNLANSGMSPAHLQYFMGHSDISVTMEHYVHTKSEDTQAEVARFQREGKLVELA